MNKATEHAEQSAVIHWALLMENYQPALKNLFAIPNAGKRSIGVAMYYKKEGLKSGVPDLMLPFPNREFHGLFIEMKSDTGRPTENQKEWISRLRDAGYQCDVCRSADEAIRLISDYLGMEAKNAY